MSTHYEMPQKWQESQSTHWSPMRLMFPTLLLGAPALTAILIVYANLAPPLAMTAVLIGLIALLVALEQRWPFRSEWRRQPGRETFTDVLYIAFASLPDRATRIAVEAAGVLLLTMWGASATTLSTSSLIAHAALAFVISDLGKYAIHRASHYRAWLWPFHMAHHQPASLSSLNALRLHAVNTAYNAAIDTLPLVLLGVPVAVGAVLATVRATIGIVQHANLDLDAGKQWLVNAPSYHRIHHAVDISVANHNFASSLLVWDRLFGTLQRGPAPIAVGITAPSHRVPRGFVGQLVYPLCRERLFTRCLLTKWVR